MLVQVFTVTLVILSAHGMGRNRGGGGYGPPTHFGYPPHPPVYTGPNHFNTLDEYHNRAGILSGIDALITDNLKDVEGKVNMATEFRTRFEQTLLPAIQQGVKDRSQAIQELRSQLMSMSSLFDEVTALAGEVDSLLGQIRQVRTSRVSEVEGPLSDLENTDIDHDTAIARLTAQTAFTYRALNNAASRVDANGQQASVIYDSLIDVVNNVNREISEVFTLELTAEQPSVTINYAKPFPAVPHVVYGIISFEATQNGQPAPAPAPPAAPVYDGYRPPAYQSGYGPTQNPGYGNPQPSGYGNAQPTVQEILDTNIEVTGDANGFTISLRDDSSLWQVNSVHLRVSAGTIENATLEFRGH